MVHRIPKRDVERLGHLFDAGRGLGKHADHAQTVGVTEGFYKVEHFILFHGKPAFV